MRLYVRDWLVSFSGSFVEVPTDETSEPYTDLLWMRQHVPLQGHSIEK